MSTEASVRLTRSDRADLWTVVVLGIIVAVIAIAHAVSRIAAIVPNSDIEVLAPFVDTTTELPIGPNGSMIGVEVDSAVLTVSGLPGIVIVSLIAAVIAQLLMTLAIVACGAILCRNLMLGRAFSRTNTRLVVTTSVVLVVGTALSGLFTIMGVNGAFATLSERSYDNVVASGNLLPYIVAAALAAVALAFKAGERLQRETEGLV
ncbi:hypothetical protein [Mycetocola zhadangensis]|uniref:DUF2975 domain-containing protein n=1 Tax=Mycetocola zhadangensis TaxID=1164595 RepID=A0A3L7J219_9MICO|nr:hypothetical protein [Mycetocola zhadangensis]RLQ84606.1 hypothetical protein D9V28_10645 [Mycetocola zhadangensis]GGE91486.1 hypothetical protein GCM10011313_12910 [Mycetocola zhadangensis]